MGNLPSANLLKLATISIAPINTRMVRVRAAHSIACFVLLEFFSERATVQVVLCMKLLRRITILNVHPCMYSSMHGHCGFRLFGDDGEMLKVKRLSRNDGKTPVPMVHVQQAYRTSLQKN